MVVKPWSEITHKTEPMSDTGIIDDRHALYVGAVLGIAMRHGLDVTPVVDLAGNYTNELVIALDVGVVTMIVPPPPDAWRIEDWYPGG